MLPVELSTVNVDVVRLLGAIALASDSELESTHVEGLPSRLKLPLEESAPVASITVQELLAFQIGSFQFTVDPPLLNINCIAAPVPIVMVPPVSAMKSKVVPAPVVPLAMSSHSSVELPL